MYNTDAGDSVVEAAGGGTDRIESAVSFSLASFAQVEDLDPDRQRQCGRHRQWSEQQPHRQWRQQYPQWRRGRRHHDRRSGDDTYIVDNAGDFIVESGGGGTDSVQSSITLDLNAFTSLENLTLTGAGNINGTGSGTSNILTGNGGNNVLDGQGNPDTLIGGAGNDTIIGGLGNDLFDGGTGADALNFGQNNDTAIFASLLEAGDIVTGFSNFRRQPGFHRSGRTVRRAWRGRGRPGRPGDPDRRGRRYPALDRQQWRYRRRYAAADLHRHLSGLTVGTAATDDIQVGS